MIKLKHDQKVIINNKRGHVFSVQGYARRYDEDVNEAINHAIDNKHSLYCISQYPTILSGDPCHSEKEKERWKNAIELKDGDIVKIEGEKLILNYMGNYSDMAYFARPKTIKYCAQCRNGENKVEADFFVKGSVYIDNEKKIPYRGYLCEDHVNIMEEDGAEFSTIKRIFIEKR